MTYEVLGKKYNLKKLVKKKNYKKNNGQLASSNRYIQFFPFYLCPLQPTLFPLFLSIITDSKTEAGWLTACGQPFDLFKFREAHEPFSDYFRSSDSLDHSVEDGVIDGFCLSQSISSQNHSLALCFSAEEKSNLKIVKHFHYHTEMLFHGAHP